MEYTVDLTPEQRAAFPRPSRYLETVYDVITEAAIIMRREPKRYNQSVWMKLQVQADSYFHDQYPQCGTVACRAGWIASAFIGATAGRALFDTLLSEFANDGIGVPGYRMAEIAEEVLGADEDNAPEDFKHATDRLFSEEALRKEHFGGDEDDYYDNGGYFAWTPPEKGTPEYAELGAQGLEAYRDRFAPWLKGRKVADLDLAKAYNEASQ